MTDRADILDEAKRLTCGDRDQSYGSPRENHKDIAAIWSVILGYDVAPHEVALCMVAVKLARCKKSFDKLDHYADMAAYAAIAGEIADAE